VDATQSAERLTRRAFWRVALVLVLATFSEGVLLTVVPAEAAAIGGLFRVSAGSLILMSTVQLLSVGICTPVFSRLGDIRGHRRMLRLALSFAAAGGVLVALAPDYGLLLGGRALEGPAGAFTPLAIGILRDRVGADRLRQGISAVVVGVSAGAALSLLATAQLYQSSGSLRAVLWIPAGCSIVAWAAGCTMVPAARERLRQAAFDWPGAVLLSAGLAAVLLLLATGSSWGWTSGRSTAALAAGVALTGGWVVVELRAADPLIDLRSLSRRALAPFYLASIPVGVAIYGAGTATVTFMAAAKSATGYGFALGVTAIAYVGLPSTVALVLGAALVPVLARRAGHKPAVYSGCAALLAGYLGMAAWHGALWQLVVANCALGLGTGLVSSSLPVVLTERAGPGSAAISTGFFITGRALGGSMASAGFAALLTGATIAHTSTPTQGAYVTIWVSCGLAALLALLVVAAAARHRPAAEPRGDGARGLRRRSRRGHRLRADPLREPEYAASVRNDPGLKAGRRR
jgi:MFS family permease